MAWIELSLDTTGEAVDWVCGLLAQTGYADSVVVAANSDASAWRFTVCFYLPQTADTDRRAAAIASALAPLHRTGLTTELQVAAVEVAAPQATPRAAQIIGRRFVVRSQNSGEPTPDEVTLWLEPSLAFGSGLHPATQLSLRLLERHTVRGMKALDLGCGTGILSVAMAKLGAEVVAADNDELAVQATEDAVARNEVASQVAVKRGSLGRGSELGHWMGGDRICEVEAIAGSFDLVVANIMARVHVELAADYERVLRRSAGVLITSGFTTDVEAEVEKALAAVGFEAIDCERFDEWVALAHRRSVAL